MQNRNSPLSPEVWLNDLFASKAVQQGGVIRRKTRGSARSSLITFHWKVFRALLTIERFAGMERFMAEIARRGYQVAENSGQMVIFCNRAPVRWLTPRDPLS